MVEPHGLAPTLLALAKPPQGARLDDHDRLGEGVLISGDAAQRVYGHATPA